jgi:uncharacterized protein YecE (DUF72 family)
MPTPEPSADERRAAVAAYDLRGVHTHLAFGTASDRYAGWIGQVYPADRWAHRVDSRARKLGGQTYEEHRVPVASVEDYFQHFSVLELDFTFYRPLLEADGRAGSNYFVLQEYADAAPPEARFLVKIPQAYTARILRRKGGFEPNPSYLNARGYEEHFVQPAIDILGDRLAGLLFQQEYNRVSDSPEPEAFAAELGGFFREVPDLPQVHVEVRSGHLLTPAYFDVLRTHGLGFCFSHWTWLPPIKEQWERLGAAVDAAFTARDGNVVLRLLTPRDMPYDRAYALAYPFDRPVPELSETPAARQMVDESVALAIHAAGSGRMINMIANNRAWGNAPALTQAVANRFLDFADRVAR